MEAGRTYHFEAVAEKDEQGRNYQDASICCTPDGPCGFKGWVFDHWVRDARCPVNPFHWIPAPIKRVRVLEDRDGRRATFLTVIGAIGSNDAPHNVFVIGSRREVKAHDSGQLVVFCNDWPGGRGTTGEARFENSFTYSNNTGKIRLSIEAK